MKNSVHAHSVSHLQWETITCWVLVEVFKIDIVNDWLVEDRKIHLLTQFGGKCGLTSTCAIITVQKGLNTWNNVL